MKSSGMLSFIASSVVSLLRSESACRNSCTTERPIVSRRAELCTRQRRLESLRLESVFQGLVAVLEHVVDLGSQTLDSGEMLHAGSQPCIVITGAALRPHHVAAPAQLVLLKASLNVNRILANLALNVHDNQICSSSSSNSSQPPAAQR